MYIFRFVTPNTDKNFMRLNHELRTISEITCKIFLLFFSITKTHNLINFWQALPPESTETSKLITPEPSIFRYYSFYKTCSIFWVLLNDIYFIRFPEQKFFSLRLRVPILKHSKVLFGEVSRFYQKVQNSVIFMIDTLPLKVAIQGFTK